MRAAQEVNKESSQRQEKWNTGVLADAIDREPEVADEVVDNVSDGVDFLPEPEFPKRPDECVPEFPKRPDPPFPPVIFKACDFYTELMDSEKRRKKEGEP
jgi:hypothetical protein